MKKTKRKKDRAEAKRARFERIGEMPLNAVGLQYYEGELRPGERVHLERDPRNAHDSNAIRVENEDFAQVGHLPKQVAQWMAPLIDQGFLYVEGRIPPGATIEHNRAPLALTLYQTPAARKLFESPDVIDSGAAALHDVMVHAWKRMKTWNDPALIRETVSKLGSAVGRNALPQTKLIMQLMRMRADELDAALLERRRDILRNTLRGLRVGSAAQYSRLTLFPLYAANGKKAAVVPLDAALKKGQARIDEVSEAGVVNALRAENLGKYPVAAFQGLIVIGGKQDRMIAATTVVWPKATATLRVGCVERNRWAHDGRAFNAAAYAPPSVRACRAPADTADVPQQGLWDAVDACLADAGVESPTSTLAAGFKSAAQRTREYARHLSLDKDAVGFAMGLDGEIAGVEVFDAPVTARKVWPLLRNGYFLQAAHGEQKKKRTPKKTVQTLLKEAAANAPGPSEGEDGTIRFAVSAGDMSGEAVAIGDRLCHVSLHPVTEPEFPEGEWEELPL